MAERTTGFRAILLFALMVATLPLAVGPMVKRRRVSARQDAQVAAIGRVLREFGPAAARVSAARSTSGDVLVGGVVPTVDEMRRLRGAMRRALGPELLDHVSLDLYLPADVMERLVREDIDKAATALDVSRRWLRDQTVE